LVLASEVLKTGHAALVVDGTDHDSIMSDPNGVVSHASLEWFDRWMTPVSE
jgi:hypothetical protein